MADDVYLDQGATGFGYHDLAIALLDTDNRARMAMYGQGEGAAQNLMANAQAGNATSAPFMPGQPSPMGGATPDENAKTALYMTPIVGSALSARDAYNSAQQGNYGDSALSALGAIPEVGGIIAGAASRTANLKKLAQAHEMTASGADPTDIWNQTGWYTGHDGMWRYEIPDDKLALRGVTAPKYANSAFSPDDPQNFNFNSFTHPALKKSYDIGEHVMGNYGPQSRFGGSYSPPETNYDPKTTNPIVKSGFIQAGGENADDATSVLLHELQHAVQQREGFATGGHPSQFSPQEVKDEQKRLMDNMSDGLWQFFNPDGTINNSGKGEMRPWIPTEPPEYYNTEAAARNTLYNRLAGEMEARNVQDRFHMSPQERLARPPWETEPLLLPFVKMPDGSRLPPFKMPEGSTPNASSSPSIQDLADAILKGQR